MKYSFSYLRDYVSARGLQLNRVRDTKRAFFYGLGKAGGEWLFFNNIDEVRKHICTFM